MTEKDREQLLIYLDQLADEHLQVVHIIFQLKQYLEHYHPAL